MTFQPLIPLSGIAGWKFLQRTFDAQSAAFEKSAQLQRDTAYFLEQIGQVSSAEALVSNRRLLSVALGAFGLQDDIENRFFIRKVLEDGTASPDALSRRLTDDRYERLSDAFGFGPGQTRQVSTPGFGERLVALYKQQAFEAAVGAQDENMRIVLYSMRELEDIVEEGKSDRAQWFTLMSLPPVRKLFETALGLPSSFSQLDIDKQQDILRDKSKRTFGTDKLADLMEPQLRDKMINTFLARSQISAFNASSSGAAIALTLLQSG